MSNAELSIRDRNRCHPRWGWLVVAAAAALLTAAVGRAAERGDSAASQWLLDLARHEALLAGQGAAAPAVERVAALLEASVRLDGRNVSAREILAELALGRGETAAAREQLAAILDVEPNHAAAAENWLPLAIEDFQTREARDAWLEAVANDATRGRYLRGLACVALAESAAAAGDPAGKVKWLAAAQERDPDHPPAAALAFALMPADATPAAQVEKGLALLRLHPGHVGASWTVASACQQVGLTEEAAAFYEHAIVVFQRSGGGSPPVDNLIDLATHLMARGDLARATQALERAVQLDPGAADAALLLHWLYGKQDATGKADALQQALADRFARVQPDADGAVVEIARAAWFYVTIDPQPQRALALAETAAEMRSEAPRIQRVLGFAQAASGAEAAARETLRPLAAEDAHAAYRLAELLQAGGEAEAAREVIEALEAGVIVGPARERLEALCGELDCTVRDVVDTAQQAGVQATLDGFDRGVFAVLKAPADTLQVTMVVEPRSLTPGVPWRARFVVVNASAYPVSLGPSWTFHPVLLLSFKMEGDKPRAYPNLFTVRFDRQRLLRPGERLELVRNLEVGPLRRAARFTPQQLQSVHVTSLFDPTLTRGGRWQAGALGFAVGPEYFNRVPAVVSAAALDALAVQVRGDDFAERGAALAQAAMLLGEAQRAAMRPLPYQPSPVPTERLHGWLLNGLGAEAALTRAQALAALEVAGLDRRLVAAAARCLEHEHWLVRLMAVRLLSRQGPAFGERAAKLVADDADSLVVRYTQTYLEQWREDEGPGGVGGGGGG